MKRNINIAVGLCVVIVLSTFGLGQVEAQPTGTSGSAQASSVPGKPTSANRRAARKAERRAARARKNAELAKIEQQNARPTVRRTNVPPDVQSLQTKTLKPDASASP